MSHKQVAEQGALPRGCCLGEHRIAEEPPLAEEEWCGSACGPAGVTFIVGGTTGTWPPGMEVQEAQQGFLPDAPNEQ